MLGRLHSLMHEKFISEKNFFPNMIYIDYAGSVAIIGRIECAEQKNNFY